jgi:hypothetical protein
MTAIIPIIIRHFSFVNNKQNKTNQRTDNQSKTEKKYSLVFNIIREILTNLALIGRGLYQKYLIRGMGMGNKRAVVNNFANCNCRFLLKHKLDKAITVVFFLTLICGLNTLSAQEKSSTLSAQDITRVQRIYGVCTMNDIDSLPKSFSTELFKHFEAQGMTPNVQRKLTTVLLPLFNAKVNKEDKQFYSNYLMNHKLVGDTQYPRTLIQDYINTFLKNNTK